MVKTEEITVLQPEASAGKPIPAASSKKRKYKGVRMRSWGSWVSEIRAPNQKTRIWLGSYSTAEAAARAYDAALICLKGSSANLNFPISTPPYIPDAVMSPKSIQRVAAAAAAAAASTDSIASSPPPATHPPPPPPTESSPPPSPSPSPSTSSSNLINDPDPYWPSCTSYANDPWLHPSPEDPWIDFDTIQSPKYATPDQMFNACSMYAPPTIEDYYYEEGDIPLWSFC